MYRYLLIALLFSITSLSQAGIYKWVDEQGNVHYSQKRPQDKQYERIKAPASAPADAQSPYATSKESDKEGDKKGSTADSESAKNAELRRKNCEAAKKNLQIYQVYNRVKDDKGNYIRLDDNDRARLIEQNKQAIEEFCN